MTHYAEVNYYDLLDVPPAAGPAEIDEAYKRQMELLTGEALATYGLFVGDDLLNLRQRVEDAYRVLKDPVRRHAYDASGYALVPPPEPTAVVEPPAAEPAFPAPEAPEAAEVPVPGAPAAGSAEALAPPPAPEGAGPEAVAALVPAPGPFDGASLRAVREGKGISLASISGRTRIAEYYLEYIEEERYESLPPAIYLRAYLRQYAQAIGVDVDGAVEAYLSRYNDAKGRK